MDKTRQAKQIPLRAHINWRNPRDRIIAGIKQETPTQKKIFNLIFTGVLECWYASHNIHEHFIIKLNKIHNMRCYKTTNENKTTKPLNN